MTPAPALGLMCARRRASSFNLTRGGPLAPPASSLTATPEPATVQSTATPLAALPVAAKAAAAPPPAAAVTAAQSVPALDPFPEEDENELSSTSSTSSHTGTSANCAHAQASSSIFGPELDEDSARLAEYFKGLGPKPSDSEWDICAQIAHATKNRQQNTPRWPGFLLLLLELLQQQVPHSTTCCRFVRNLLLQKLQKQLY